MMNFPGLFTQNAYETPALGEGALNDKKYTAKMINPHSPVNIVF